MCRADAHRKEDIVSKAVVINGSPLMERGDTAMVLTPFLQGMRDSGSDVELFYASRLDVTPCTCGAMICWYQTPGVCCFQDDMQMLYSRLGAADTLVFATPVYIPLPGAMQNVLNRLCPLVHPLLRTRQGRTRAGFREEVGIERIAVVATGGWWEKENCGTVVHIVEEFAETASVSFAGAVLRPHAFLMKEEQELSEEGRVVASALRRAGGELVREGSMEEETLAAISRPLISEDELRTMYNQWL
jgi:multimeric flavodoxin WrbA